MSVKARLFLCDYCGSRFEALASNGNNVRCPECGTRGCEKIEEKDE